MGIEWDHWGDDYDQKYPAWKDIIWEQMAADPEYKDLSEEEFEAAFEEECERQEYLHRTQYDYDAYERYR